MMDSWSPAFEAFWQSVKGKELRQKVEVAYQETEVFPDRNEIFRAFDLTPFDQVKVVILGQDPYHGVGQANGLAFSVHSNVAIPPSLKNIFKELESDLGILSPNHGDLQSWAQQGVLLLNTSLTVEAGKAHSHKHLRWDDFTRSIIFELSDKREHLVFILWGKHAQSFKSLINVDKHAIIESVHPSPLSAYRGFFGSKPFSKTNQYLQLHLIYPIDWEITSL